MRWSVGKLFGIGMLMFFLGLFALMLGAIAGNLVFVAAGTVFWSATIILIVKSAVRRRADFNNEYPHLRRPKLSAG
ncbi:MAG: hypothetical protein LBN43_00985, partial [Oscillospiraceae bacterium]|nr:hypothetical protein [Oscillospiraceae bacterium]